MRIQKFEDLLSWKKGKLLYIEINKCFINEKDYFFKDQILRAALSVTNNIAEGFDRRSDKELCQFLVIARGSAAEVKSMVHIAVSVGKISNEQADIFIALTDEIARLLTGLMKTLMTSDKRLETK